MPTKIEAEGIRSAASGDWVRTLALVKEQYPAAVARAKRERAKARDVERFGATPEWARRLIRKHTDGGLPNEVSWHRRKGTDSSGHCDWYRIHVTAGTDRKDATFVLLHEIAHWNAGPQVGHGPAFYDALVPLVKAEGLLRYGQVRDGRGLKSAASRARKEER